MNHLTFQAEANYADALADLENLRREPQTDEDRVLEYIRLNANPSISEISHDTGIRTGRGKNPHKAPLNHILITLRDAGKITASDNQWGEPRFTVV